MNGNRRKSTCLVLALCLGGAASPLGCTDFSDRVPPEIDCAAGDDYDVDTDGIGDFEPEECQWYGVEDRTGTVDCDDPSALKGPDNIHVETVISMGGSVQTVAEVPTGFCDGPRYSQAVTACEEIPEGPRCGSSRALHLTGNRNNDWGGFFGNYAIAQTSTSVAEWEGLAFWARAEAGSERSFTLELDDKYTASITDDFGEPDPNYESECIIEEAFDSSQPGVTNVSSSGAATLTTGVAGWVPSEDACGNPYEYQLSVTNDWQLYLVSFDEFMQKPLPNRHVEGFDRTSFRGLRIRPPKDTVVDLWIDDFGFYRTPGKGGLGGATPSP